MPRKALKPCKYPGCAKLTEHRYCAEHQAAYEAYKAARDENYKKEYNRKYNKERRDPETSSRYDTAWRQIRTAYAMSHPLCEECLRLGKMVPVAEVHHILPLSQGGTNDVDNLMSLCRSCHARKHVEIGDRVSFAPRGGYKNSQ